MEHERGAFKVNRQTIHRRG